MAADVAVAEWLVAGVLGMWLQVHFWAVYLVVAGAVVVALVEEVSAAAPVAEDLAVLVEVALVVVAQVVVGKALN